MNPDYQILLYYNYTHIDEPELFLEKQKELCLKLNLKGRIIIAKEGINGTLEGKFSDTEAYVKELCSDKRFTNTHIKRSAGTGNAFPRLSIKLRNEIVSAHLGDKDVNPAETTGKYITAEELHEWIHSDKEFYIVDMRNDYEHKVGYFDKSILAPFKNFRELPKMLTELVDLKSKTIVTVCTGGVRCEKASGFLVANDFKDVYQLYGGIVTYMEKYPNEDFLGKLYVFDGRITVGFNTDDPAHIIVGKCEFCNKSADTYRDCKNLHCKGKRHFICCDECFEKDKGYCSKECSLQDKK